MSIISRYVREDWRYSVSDIKELFQFTSGRFQNAGEANLSCKNFIKALCARNILKLAEDEEIKEKIADIEFADYSEDYITDANNKYKFSFVGILSYKDYIIYSYPKYIGPLTQLPEYPPKEKLAQIIRVIEKYSRDKHRQHVHDIDLFADIDDNGRINILSVMLFLLEDYAANGPFVNDEIVIEQNGPGEIIWQKTVDETDPIFQNGQPCYVDLFTRRNVNNDNDYFTRLHEYVVTRCSSEMEKIGLTDFFCLPLAEISDDEENSFGDSEYVVDMINKAISTTYDDRKLSVLKALKAYFNSDRVLTGTNEIQLIGSRSFNLIWEEVCGSVFSNQKNKNLKDSTFIPKPNDNILKQVKDKSKPTLVELIEHPKWVKDRSQKDDNGDYHEVIADRTLNPDYLGFSNDDSEFYFYILDAKYYRPIWTNKTIKRQPGIEDITKQYLYRLAYVDYLSEFNVKEENVKNYFLLPHSDDDYSNNGFVELDMLKSLGLGEIEIRMLNPERLYDFYLNNKKLPLSYLD